jgi:hypothetical protein
MNGSDVTDGHGRPVILPKPLIRKINAINTRPAAAMRGVSLSVVCSLIEMGLAGLYVSGAAARCLERLGPPEQIVNQEAGLSVEFG